MKTYLTVAALALFAAAPAFAQDAKPAATPAAPAAAGRLEASQTPRLALPRRR